MVRIVENRSGVGSCDHVKRGKVEYPTYGVHDFPGNGSEHGFRAAVRYENVLVRGGSCQSNWGDSEQKLHARIEGTNVLNDRYKICPDLVELEIVEPDFFGVPVTSDRARGRGVDSPARNMIPPFGESKREHEQVSIAYQSADGS